MTHEPTPDRLERRLRLRPRGSTAPFTEFEISVHPSATVLELAAECADQLSVASFRGLPSLFIWDGRARLDGGQRVEQAQLLQYQEIEVGSTSRDWPSIAGLDPSAPIVMWHTAGPQLGHGWTVGIEPVHLVARSGWLLPVVEGEEPHLSIAPHPDDPISTVQILARADAVRLNGNLVVDRTSNIAVSMSTDVSIEVEGEQLSLRVDRTPDYLGKHVVDGWARYVPTVEGITATAPTKQTVPGPGRFPSGEVRDRRIEQVLMYSGFLIVSVVMGLVTGRWLAVIPGAGFFLFMVGMANYRFGKEKNEVRAKKQQWKNRCDRQRGALISVVREEVAQLDDVCRSLSSLVLDAEHRRGALWTFDKRSPWFLQVPVGRSDYQSQSAVEFRDDVSNDEDHAWFESFQEARWRSGAPLLADLSADHLGLVGPRSVCSTIAGGLLVRVALTHSPSDVHFAILTTESREVDWYGLRGLPHLQALSPWSTGGGVLTSAQEINAFLQDVHDALLSRAEGLPRLVIVLDGTQVVGADTRHWLAELREHLSLVWLSPSASALDRDVGRLFLSVEDEEVGTWAETGHAVGLLEWTSDLVARAVTAMRALRGVAGLNTASSLPPNVPYADLRLGPAPEGLLERSMPISLGLSRQGQLTLDLVQDGPHILIGGTTGSGKSLLLQLMTLSLIDTYRPDQVRLLLVDYKGGATFSTFGLPTYLSVDGRLKQIDNRRTVPHVVGNVSNLKDSNVDRLISFLESELLRRQNILQSTRGEYEHYAALGRTDLPRLVVLIDEFAAFVQTNVRSRGEAVLDIAARGRSLGVHLVIATQSPREVVDSQVRANVNARIALRTLDERGSTAIIDSNMAATIRNSQKGRGYLRSDTGTIVEFQSGMVESREMGRRSHHQKVVVLRVGQVAQSSIPEFKTDLETILEGLAPDQGTKAQPSLGPELAVQPDDDFRQAYLSEHGLAYVGRMDDARRQSQPLVSAQILSGAVAFVTPGGASTAISSALFGSVRAAEPEARLVSLSCGHHGTELSSLSGDTNADVREEATKFDVLLACHQVLHLPPTERSSGALVLERLDLLADSLTEGNCDIIAQALSTAKSVGVLMCITWNLKVKLPTRVGAACSMSFQVDDPNLVGFDDQHREIRLFRPRLVGSASSPNIALGILDRPPTLPSPSRDSFQLSEGKSPIGFEETTGVPVALDLDSARLNVVGRPGQVRTAIWLMLIASAAREVGAPIRYLSLIDISSSLQAEGVPLLDEFALGRELTEGAHLTDLDRWLTAMSNEHLVAYAAYPSARERRIHKDRLDPILTHPGLKETAGNFDRPEHAWNLLEKERERVAGTSSYLSSLTPQEALTRLAAHNNSSRVLAGQSFLVLDPIPRVAGGSSFDAITRIPGKRYRSHQLVVDARLTLDGATCEIVVPIPRDMWRRAAELERCEVRL